MGIWVQATKGNEKYILFPSQEEDILIDVSSVENGEIGEVLGDLSRTISFPATEENNRFFENAFQTGHQNIPGTYDSIPVTLETDIETLFVGSMTLDSWDKVNNSYVCSIQSGTLSLKDAIGDKALNDSTLTWPTGLVYNFDTWKAANEVQEAGYDALDYYLPFVDLGFDDESRPRIPNSNALASSAANRASETIVLNTGNPTDAYGNDTTRVGSGEAYYVDQDTQTIINGATFVSGTQYHGEIATGQQAQGYITSYTTPLRIEQLVPAVKLRHVLDRIFEQAGYTWEAKDANGLNIFDTMLGDVFLLPKVRKGLGIEGVEQSLNNRFVGVAATASGVDLNPGVQTVVAEEVDRLVWQFSPTGTETDPSNAWTGTSYTVDIPGTYEWNFKGNLFNVSDNFDTPREYISLKACVLVNNIIVESVNLEDIREDYTTNDNGWDFTATFNAYKGDKVSAAIISYSRKVGHIGTTHDMTGSFQNVQFSTTELPKVWNGASLDLASQFGDLKSKEILKGVMQKFHFVAYSDKDKTKHVILRQYYDAVLGSARLDWSDKVDRSSFEYSSLLQDQEKSIDFTDKEGEDRFTVDIEPVVGSVLAESSDEGVTSGEKTIGDFFTSLKTGAFNRVGDLSRTSHNNGYHGVPHIYELEDTDQKSVEGGIYLGYSKCVNFDGTFFYEGSNDERIAYTNVVRTLSEYNEENNRTLAWESEGAVKGAYDTYWAEYFRHLYGLNNVKLTCDVLLTPAEYKTIKGFERIHIDGNDYLINKVSGWNLSRPDVISVELISYRNNFVNVFEPKTVQYVEPEVAYKRTYNLGVQVIGYDGPVSGGVLFDNPVVQQDKYNISVVGQMSYTEGSDSEPATTHTEVITIKELEDYEISASNFTATTVPTGVTVNSITDGPTGEVLINITITSQSVNSGEVLVISGEVDRASDSSTNFDITWSLDSGYPVGTTITDLGLVRGTIGGTAIINAIINPPDGQSLSASSFSVQGALPTGVDSVAFTSLGTGIFVTARVTFQSSNTSVNLTVDGNDPTTLPTGTQTSEVTFDFTENIENVSTINDLTFRGVVGTRSDIQIPLYAADGYNLDSDNFSATIQAGKNYVTMFDAVGGGETVQIPLAIVWPGTNDTVGITLNGAAQLGGADTSNVTVNFTTTNNNVVLTETTETFTGNAGQTLQYTNDIIANDNINISALSVGTITGDTSAVSLEVTGTGERGRIHGTITFGNNDATANIPIEVTSNSIVVAATEADFADASKNGGLAAEEFKTFFSANGNDISFRFIPTVELTSLPSGWSLDATFYDSDMTSGILTITTTAASANLLASFGVFVGATGTTDNVGGTGGTGLDAIQIIKQSAADIEILDTMPVNIGSVTGVAAYRFSYTDEFGETQQRALTIGQEANFCCVGGVSGVTKISDSSTAAQIQAGSISCTAGGDSATVNGYNIQVSSSAPASGTSNTTITFVT